MEDAIIQKSLIRCHKFWIPVIVSFPVTIICAVVAALTADFGFKTYEAAMIFFPYMMLSTLWFGAIPPAIGIASLFQWPLYGVITGKALVKGKLVATVEIVLLLHLVAVVLAIKFIKYAEVRPVIYTISEPRRANRS